MNSQDSKKPRVLLVDDEKNLVLMLSKILTRHGYEVLTAHDGEEARALLEANLPSRNDPADRDLPEPIDAVLTDLRMPKMDGHKLLDFIRDNYPELPVIVLTGHGSIQSAVEAMKAGAADYLIKPANPDEILIVLRRALELSHLRVENRQLKARATGPGSQPGYEIIGRSHAVARVLETVRLVARNRSTVHISGESGTGKELIARAIHDSGPFVRFPFIAVNCGALSETLLESQLFGHRKGAFTGAVTDHVGFFQAAEGGTLFLDEISEMSPNLQVKLLRAIQQREIIPVGDTQPVRINLRIVCASNRDLEYEVRRRNFRQDLFYRLSVVNLHLPPLRDRVEDVPDLVGHFILHYAREYSVAPKTVQPDAMGVLVAYPWPGNVRELQNVIERTFAISTSETITAHDLPPQLFRSPEEAMAAVQPMEDDDAEERPRTGGTLRPAARSARAPEHPLGPAPAPAPATTTPAPHPAPGPLVPGNGPAAHAPTGAPGLPAAQAVPRFSEPFVPKAPEPPATLDEMEKRQIMDALRRAKGRKVEAARILGIDRKRLYRKMKKYDLE